MDPRHLAHGPFRKTGLEKTYKIYKKTVSKCPRNSKLIQTYVINEQNKWHSDSQLSFIKRNVADDIDSVSQNSTTFDTIVLELN